MGRRCLPSSGQIHPNAAYKNIRKSEDNKRYKISILTPVPEGDDRIKNIIIVVIFRVAATFSSSSSLFISLPLLSVESGVTDFKNIPCEGRFFRCIFNHCTETIIEILTSL